MHLSELVVLIRKGAADHRSPVLAAQSVAETSTSASRGNFWKGRLSDLTLSPVTPNMCFHKIFK